METLVPGVYRQTVVPVAAPRLRTGVVGLVGFADPADPLDDLAWRATPANTPVALQRKEDFVRSFKAHRDGFLADAVAGFFDNGGTRCYVVRAGTRDGEALVAALGALDRVADLDLVAVPDAVALPAPDARRVQREALAHCARHGDRFAILDACQGLQPEQLAGQREDLSTGATEPLAGALYYPWLVLPGRQQRLVPPSGHVAGIYARSDARAGVFKAPANEEILGIADVEIALAADAQALLNPLGVNCLCALPGRGIRVWGARTLSRQDEWRYVNVRRLFLTVRRWIALNMGWAAFEPNDAQLWNRIRRELEAWLMQLWRQGAFAGTTPEESFFVKCDAETNPPELRELGQVATEIGLAPGAPAEFIVVRITQRTPATS